MAGAEYGWDDEKAEANLEKHGIDFEDAIGVFEGPVLEIRSDQNEEERYKVIGMLEELEITVVYTRRGSRRRIISARRARTNERVAYHQAYPRE